MNKGKILFGIIGILIIALITAITIFICFSKDKEQNENDKTTISNKYSENAIKIMKEKNLYNKIRSYVRRK